MTFDRPKPDESAIRQALDIMHEPDDIIELRALFQRGRPRTDAGYFDGAHRDLLAREAARLNAQGAAVYINLNPINPQLLGRYTNRIEEYARSTATDANVIHRRWLLVDIDPVRPKDTSATAAQFEAARLRTEQCRNYLHEKKEWDAAIYAESGNGYHLLYRLDLPNNIESRDIVKNILTALAERFDDDLVKVDTSVFNAARIIKLYGTVANKGDHAANAPWRLSRIVSVANNG